MVVNPLQPSKQPYKLVTELGIVMEVKPLQSLKQPVPSQVTELGMVMVVNPLQPSKQPLPSLVTELGMVKEVMEDNLLQPEKQ